MKKTADSLINAFQNRNKSASNEILAYYESHSPLAILIILLFWLFLGINLDKWLGSKSIFTLTCIIIATCQIFIRMLKFK